MTKAEWGTKRICSECATRYYDMRKDPPVCPKCGTVFQAISAKAKRKPGPPEEKVVAKGPRKPKVGAEVELEGKALDEGVEDDEDEELIEDASELGEDDEDVSEVIETKVEGEDIERGR